MANLPWLQVFTISMLIMIFMTCMLSMISQTKMLKILDVKSNVNKNQTWMW